MPASAGLRLWCLRPLMQGRTGQTLFDLLQAPHPSTSAQPPAAKSSLPACLLKVPSNPKAKGKQRAGQANPEQGHEPKPSTGQQGGRGEVTKERVRQATQGPRDERRAREAVWQPSQGKPGPRQEPKPPTSGLLVLSEQAAAKRHKLAQARAPPPKHQPAPQYFNHYENEWEHDVSNTDAGLGWHGRTNVEMGRRRLE